MNGRRRAAAAVIVVALLLAVKADQIAGVLRRSVGGPIKTETGIVRLRWSPGSEWLLIENRWLLRAPREPIREVPCAAGATAVEFSPDGRQILAVQGQSLCWGLAGGPAAGRMTAPLWVDEQSSPSEYAAGATRTHAFWLSENSILVHQANPFTDDACRILNLPEGNWSSITGACPVAPGRIEGVHSAPGGWLLIQHSMEGWWAVQITRYDPATGQRQFALAELNPPLPIDMVQLQFGQADGELFLSTPCNLADCEFPGPCDCPSGPWTVYRWVAPAKSFEPWLQNTHASAVPSPDGRRLAWIEKKNLCISQLPAHGSSHCIQLPR